MHDVSVLLVPLFAAALFQTVEGSVLQLLARNLKHTMQTSRGARLSGKVLELARDKRRWSLQPIGVTNRRHLVIFCVQFNDAVNLWACYVGDRWRKVHGPWVDWQWQRTLAVVGDKLSQCHCASTLTRLGPAWDWTQSFTVRGRRLIARDIKWMADLSTNYLR